MNGFKFNEQFKQPTQTIWDSTEGKPVGWRLQVSFLPVLEAMSFIKMENF